MRVLWFSTTPSLAAKFIENSPVGGSWIESLETGFMDYSDIELGIVFSKLVKEPQEYRSEVSSTRYFMVPRHPYRKFNRWINRLTGARPSEKPLAHYTRIVNEFQPDVVLFFGSESDYSLIIPQLSMPSVIWFQGNLTVYNNMYEIGIPINKTLGNEKLKDFIKGDTLFHRYQFFKQLVERENRIFSVAQNFIGRTNWDHRVVNILSPQAKYFHCDDPLRRPFWKNKWSQHQNRDTYIITTTIQGNIYKGLETIYKASDLLADLITTKLEWRIIGIEEGTAYVKSSQKIAKFPNADPKVRLLGIKSGSELVKELLNADMYVHPSHIENAPNAVQEAMLLGMPVIATNVGGTPSLITDGLDGLLVQSKDHVALAGAILELYRSPSKAEKMGENARERALIRNDSKSICRNLYDILQELATNS